MALDKYLGNMSADGAFAKAKRDAETTDAAPTPDLTINADGSVDFNIEGVNLKRYTKMDGSPTSSKK